MEINLELFVTSLCQNTRQFHEYIGFSSCGRRRIRILIGFSKANLSYRPAGAGQLNYQPVFTKYLDDRLFGTKPVDAVGDVIEHTFHLFLGWFLNNARFE